MPVKQVLKKLNECTCACPSHPDCPHKAKPWFSESIPARCAACKCHTWNRPARLSSKAPLTFNGETHTVAEWSRKLGLAKTTIPWRIKQGWPMEQVLSNEDWRYQQKSA